MGASIAFRYLIARGSPLTYVSRLSLFGLVLSVAVLVVVVSVVNGFERELRERVLGVLPHVTASGLGGLSEQSLLEVDLDLGGLDASSNWSRHGIVALAPYVSDTMLLWANGEIETITVTGVEATSYRRVTDLEDYLAGGDLAVLTQTRYGIVLGATIAERLDVGIGDDVRVVLPTGSVSPAGLVPRQRRFQVVDTFASESQLDGQAAFVDIATAQKLLRTGGKVHGVQGRLSDLFKTQSAESYLTTQLGSARIRVRSWMATYGSLYQAIAVQKLTMFVLLSFLVAVAAFNLISGLMMIVEQRRADVAILRTLGASTITLMGVFCTLGFVLAFFGIAIGLLTGVGLANALPSLFVWLSGTFELSLMTQYFIAYLPVDVRSTDLILVAAAATTLAIVATVYPAWRATRLAPSVELAHE